MHQINATTSTTPQAKSPLAPRLDHPNLTFCLDSSWHAYFVISTIFFIPDCPHCPCLLLHCQHRRRFEHRSLCANDVTPLSLSCDTVNVPLARALSPPRTNRCQIRRLNALVDRQARSKRERSSNPLHAKPSPWQLRLGCEALRLDNFSHEPRPGLSNLPHP